MGFEQCLLSLHKSPIFGGFLSGFQVGEVEWLGTGNSLLLDVGHRPGHHLGLDG